MTDKYKLSFRTLNLINNRLYCLCLYYNCIFYIDLQDYRIHYSGRLECEYSFQIALSCKAINYNKGILYSPYYASNIHYFDVTENKDYIIDGVHIDLEKNKYHEIICDDQKCFLIPYIGNEILVIDMSSRKCIKSISLQEVIFQHNINVKSNLISESNSYEYKDKYYFALEDKPLLIELDTTEEKIQAINLDEIQGAYSVAGYQNYLYILSKDKCIITFDIEENKIIDKTAIKENLLLFNSLCNGEDIIFWQPYKDDFIIFNVISKCVEYRKFNCLFDANKDINEDYKLVGVINDNEFVFISDKKNIAFLDIASYDIRREKLLCDDIYIYQSLMENTYFKKMNLEYTELTLPAYIDYVIKN